jgi:hypothetical protein
MPLETLHALIDKTHAKIDQLESLIIEQEQKLQQPQPAAAKQNGKVGQIDLFGNWVGGPPANKAQQVQSAILARKVDSTIERVQSLIQQAKAQR